MSRQSVTFAENTIMRAGLPPAVNRTLSAKTDDKSIIKRVTLKRPADAPRMKRVLIISASYTPLVNPRAFRWSAIAEQWCADGYNVDVITTWNPGLAKQEKLFGVKVTRTGGEIIERLRSILRPATRSVAANVETGSDDTEPSLLKQAILKLARRIHDSIWKSLYWPDYACLWWFSATRQARKFLDSAEYDTLITVSDPFTSHLVGKSLKKHYPELRWIVDIGDPFAFRNDSPTNNHRIYHLLNYKVERRIFQVADLVTVTTGATQTRYSELFPESSDKIKAIGPMAPALIAPIDKLPGNSLLSDNGKTKLVFAGALYRTIRNPEYLLSLYERLLSGKLKDNIELHFLGGYDDCKSFFAPYENELGRSLFLHGLVSRCVTMQTLVDADIVINIGNHNPYQLPSKVVEYVTLDKRIVNISSIENDSSRKFFQSYPKVLQIDSFADAHCDGEETAFDKNVSELERFIAQEDTLSDSQSATSILTDCSPAQISMEYLNEICKIPTRARSTQSRTVQETWHVYYATKGAAGGYIDALLKASVDAGISARAYVSATYDFGARSVRRVFFPITDRVSSRGRLLKLLRGIELCVGYAYIGLRSIIERPRIVVHLIDDFLVTYLFYRFSKAIGLEVWLMCHDVSSHYQGMNSYRSKMITGADRLITHSAAARDSLTELFGAEIMAKHIAYPFPASSYDEIIKNQDRIVADQNLSELIPQGSGYYLFIGVVRSSKGIEVLLNAWAKMDRSSDEHLVIAGVWTDPNESVRKQAEDDPSCIVIDRYLTDAEFVRLIEGARFVVLPYQDYAHSSVCAACGNHGGAVIISDIKLFTDDLPGYDLTFVRGNSLDLAEILERSMKMSDEEVVERQTILHESVKRSAESLVQQVKIAYGKR